MAVLQMSYWSSQRSSWCQFRKYPESDRSEKKRVRERTEYPYVELLVPFPTMWNPCSVKV